MQQSTISGYTVKATLNNIPYTLTTVVGVRGINIPCTVFYENGEWKVIAKSGLNLGVKHAICDLKGIALHDTAD